MVNTSSWLLNCSPLAVCPAVTGDALVKGPQHEEDSKSLMSLAAHTNTVSSKMTLSRLTYPVSTNPDFTFVAFFLGGFFVDFGNISYGCRKERYLLDNQ